MTDSANSRRWWIRLWIKPSLRVLMTGVLVAACVLGWIVHLAEVQRDAVAAIKRIGGSVQYEWQFKDGRMVTNGEPRGAKWLSRFLGVDYFDTVTNASLTGKATDQDMARTANLNRIDTLTIEPKGLTDDGFAQLDRMRGLRWLTISAYPPANDAQLEAIPPKTLARLRGLNIGQNNFTDAGLRHLSGGLGLELLDLSGSRISGNGLTHIEGLVSLRHLFLDGTRLDDEGLAYLERFKNLENLSIKNTNVTQEGMRKFQQTMPNVTLYR